MCLYIALSNGLLPILFPDTEWQSNFSPTYKPTFEVPLIFLFTGHLLYWTEIKSHPKILIELKHGLNGNDWIQTGPKLGMKKVNRVLMDALESEQDLIRLDQSCLQVNECKQRSSTGHQ